MTTIITLLREPVEVDFSDLVPGLTMRIQRLTSMDFEIVRARAARAQKSLEQGAEVFREYGINGLDGFSSLEQLDRTDPFMMAGLMALVATVETGLIAIKGWTGLYQENGLPAPISKPVLFKLFADSTLKDRFVEEVGKAANILRIEKKDLPASPNGTATGAETGSAQNTAPVAPNSISPAPEASAVPADASAPRPS